ncbi:MAG: hypothetical protein E7016_03975 [Alphaproteobacteria bacterium]|nr:hypothetical protein [Alphaproteobacteria bacterium]
MLGKTNVSVDKKIVNQDITICENGIYSAQEGYSGLGTVTVDVLSTSIISAQNKTGKVIKKNDKVWLSSAPINVGSYRVTWGTSAYRGIISRNGKFVWCNRKLYSVGDGSCTELSDCKVSVLNFKYMADNCIVTTSNSSTDTPLNLNDDEPFLYSIACDPVADDIFYVNELKTFCKLNVKTGEILQTWTTDEEIMEHHGRWFKIGNKVYCLYCKKYYTLQDDGTLSAGTTFTMSGKAQNLYTVQATLDGKYIITGSSVSGYTGERFEIFEVTSDNVITRIMSSKLPAFFSRFISADCGVSFNPYTGILTACINGTKDYLFAKYENGEWKQICLPLPIPAEKMIYAYEISVTDDLSKVAFHTREDSVSYNGTNYVGYTNGDFRIADFVKPDGYVAVAYKYDNIDENIVTGYANNDADADNGIEVIVANNDISD